MANKFNKRVKAAVRKRIKRMEKKDLLNPKKQLSGKQVRKAAGALTKIELNPAINAYKRQKKATGRQMRRDVRGLNKLGNRTAGQLESVNETLAGAGSQSVAAQQQAADSTDRAIAIRNAIAQQTANKQNTSTEAATNNTLLNSGVDPLGSGSAQAAKERREAQMLRLTQTGNDQANLASILGNAAVQNTQGQVLSNATRGRDQISSLRTIMAQRIADERAAARESMRESQGKVAELKAQRGPTRLKNIMDIRSGERDYGLGLAGVKNERRAIGIDAAAQRETERHNRAGEADADADRHLSKAELKLKRQQQKWERQHPNAGSSSSSAGGENPSKISKKEWKQWSAGARNLIDQEGSVPRGKKGWQQFADDLAKQEGITWSPVEREAFIRRIRKRG